MVITITGNIQYPITLDPSVWIFDDRKVHLNCDDKTQNKYHQKQQKDIKQYQQINKPPVQKSLQYTKQSELLSYSYYMPLKDFILRTEPSHVATSAILATKSGKQTITLTELLNSNALFSKNGKQIIKDGPIYLFKESDIHFEFPIKGISSIYIY